MNYAVEMASNGVIYLSIFVNIGSGIYVLLRLGLLPQQFETL
jgi:hypothetical protein